MSVQETSHKEIVETQSWLLVEKEETIYNISICEVIEPRTYQIIDEIDKKDSILEADLSDSEVRILDWILYIVCTNEIKKFERWCLYYRFLSRR